jgi:hypothetical protein
MNPIDKSYLTPEEIKKAEELYEAESKYDEADHVHFDKILSKFEINKLPQVVRILIRQVVSQIDTDETANTTTAVYSPFGAGYEIMNKFIRDLFAEHDNESFRARGTELTCMDPHVSYEIKLKLKQDLMLRTKRGVNYNCIVTLKNGNNLDICVLIQLAQTI